ncbi:effector-associated constant component EACC1 [Actinomadura meridiana]|uniref:effector-associated constant component EACC1 n=1 Tax=Actinomadura meridiana TaxID=559626 RepID=UPI0031EBD0A6
MLRDLRRLGLAASLPPARAPRGAKSGAAVTLATLLVAISGSAASRALVTGIFGWLGPRKGKVKISSGDTSIELSAATPAERERLVEWLLARGE